MLPSLLLLLKLSILVLGVFVFFCFQYIVPGVLALDKLSLRPLLPSALSRLVLGAMVSLSCQALLFFLLGNVFGAGVYVFSLPFFCAGIFGLPVFFQEVKELFAQLKSHLAVGLFVGFCILSLSSTIFLSWIPTKSGLVFQDGQLHDSVWHIALINNLKSSIPPVHPAASETVVTEYHYFYDLVIALFAHNYGFNVPFLYFQFFPLFLSWLLAGSCIVLMKTLHSKNAAILLLFFTFFGGSLAYVLPFIIPGHLGGESSFWVSQTFASMINPQIILTLATTNLVVWLISLDSKTHSFRTRLTLHTVLLLLVVASLGFKSYGWMVLGALYAGYGIFQAVKERDFLPLMAGVSTLACSLPSLWLITGFKASSFTWLPFWYLTTMMEAQDRVFYPVWRLQQDTYLASGNWLGVARITLQELVVFVLGNLGTRALLFLLPLWYFFRRPSTKLWAPLTTITLGLLFSASFPLFFIQKQSIWNSIQFWYYTLLLANMLVSIFLAELLAYFKPTRATLLLCAFLVLLLTLPTYLSTQWSKVTRFSYFQANQLELLSHLPSDAKVVLCPGNDDLFKTSFITSYTSLPVYLANSNQLSITNSTISGDAKEAELREILEAQDPGRLYDFMDEYSAKYFLCNNSSWLPAAQELGDQKVCTLHGCRLQQSGVLPVAIAHLLQPHDLPSWIHLTHLVSSDHEWFLVRIEVDPRNAKQLPIY